MFLADLLTAFLIAIALVILFGVLIRGEAIGAGLLWFFLLLFLATWAGGVWVAPVGPPLFGVSWLGFLLVGLFFALLIMALLPPAPPRSLPPGEMREEVETEATAFAAVNAFFWILLIGFVVAIAAGYLI